MINGVASQIAVPGASLSFGSGINNNGLIVGAYENAQGFFGFELQNSQFTTVDVPASSYTEILGVNDAGAVVGAYGDNAGSHGYIFQNGTYTALNAPGADSTQLWAIDDVGNVAGTASGSAFCHTNDSCGFFYDGSTFTVIAAGPGTTVQAMNNLDDIVGYFNGPDGSVSFEAIPDSQASATPEPSTRMLFSSAALFTALLTRVRRRGANTIER